MDREVSELEDLQFKIIVEQTKTINKLYAALYRGDKYGATDADGNDISLQQAKKYEDRANGTEA